MARLPAVAPTQLSLIRAPTPDRWIALASPEPRRPMMRKVEQIAGPLRAYVADLASTLRLKRDDFEQLYAPRVSRLGFQVASRWACRASSMGSCGAVARGLRDRFAASERDSR